MKIHEYQGKEIFAVYGIPISKGKMVTNGAEALEAARELGMPVVIKAMVHVGGRGKAGGVKVVQKENEVVTIAEHILHLTIKDLPVRTLLVTQAVDIESEVYLSLLIDRNARKLVFIGCADGGVEIEETAKTSPEKILRLEIPVQTMETADADLLRPLAEKLFGDPSHVQQTIGIMQGMLTMFGQRDCSLIEINPLVLNTEGKVIALDAKVLLDDNALFRQSYNEALRDMDAEDRDELEAKEAGLSFIRLSGEIGCMVNGAGLAMTTMDTIKLFGGSPANFLDVGGSSNPQKVVAAFKHILRDKNVSIILINIFGGITRCDDIAQGIIQARKEIDVSVPLIVRLVGTNEKEGRALLQNTDMTSAATLVEGAKTAIAMRKK